MDSVLAELRSPIPFPPEKVRNNAPIRWDLGLIPMVTPLFSLYRYNLFVRSCQLLPIVMVQKEIMPFWQFIDIPKDMPDVRDLAEEIKENLQLWKSEKRFEQYVDDLYALLIAVSDPVEPETALGIVINWNIEQGGWLPMPESPIKNPVQMRTLLHAYALHVLDIDSAALLLNQIRQLNTTFKKKLNILALEAVVTESPRRKLWKNMFQKSTDKPQNGQ